jgi:hypothetical protein
MQAYLDGKQIQVKLHDDTWANLDQPQFSGDPSQYRVKPVATQRKWTAEEVPVGCLVRSKRWQAPARAILTCIEGGPDAKVCVWPSDRLQNHVNDWVTTEGLYNDFEHSTDGGKTWQFCGVSENI